MKHNRKMLVLNSCLDCPKYVLDDNTSAHKWGKHWCNDLDVELTPTTEEGFIVIDIPNECPLPNIQ